MKLDDNIADEIGIALNEATLFSVEYDPARNILVTKFSVLTLSDDRSPEPSDQQRQIIFTNIGRISAALRNARWDDLTAQPVSFGLSDLPTIVKSFGGQPIYGWEFINNDDEAFDHWQQFLSLDFIPQKGSLDNRLMLFQESTTTERHLDLWVWFSDILIQDPSGNTITITDFTTGGKRWWDAMYSGDSRTQGHGIFSAGKDG